jgi:hypothetical protein
MGFHLAAEGCRDRQSACEGVSPRGDRLRERGCSQDSDPRTPAADIALTMKRFREDGDVRSHAAAAGGNVRRGQLANNGAGADSGSTRLVREGERS